MRRFAILLLLVAGCSIADGQVRFGKTPTPQAEQVGPEPIAPVISVPAVMEGDVGDFIRVTATTNGKKVKWMSMDRGLSVFPSDMLVDPKSTVVIAKAPGSYRLAAYTALNGEASDHVVCMVVVHGPQPPPPKPEPVPPPPEPTPPPPPPAPTTFRPLWVVTVENSVARTQVITDIINNPIWGEFQASGHQWAHENSTNAKVMAKFDRMIKANGGLPCLIIMDAQSLQWLNVEPADLRLPSTAEALRARVAKYSGVK